MSFVTKMNQMKALEQEIARMVESLKADLTTAVKNQPFQGRMINDGSNGGPIMGVIMASQLAKTGNWSPEYHFPQSQAEAVSKKIASSKTASQVCAAVKAMIAEEKVKMPDGHIVKLNGETLKVLKESEIGQYVATNE